MSTSSDSKNLADTTSKSPTTSTKDFEVHASVFLSEYRISFNLAEWKKPDEILTSHQFSVPVFGDAIDEQNLVSMIFESAERETGWEIITDGVVFTPNLREGFGLDRVDFVVSPARKKYADEINIAQISWSDGLKSKFLHQFMLARNIEDLIYVEANTSEIIIWRLKAEEQEKFLLDKIGKYTTDDSKTVQADQSDQPQRVRVSNLKLDWGDVENKAKEKHWESLSTFLTSSKSESELKDIWANLMFSPKLKYESVLAQDILRADITSNLNALKISAFKELADFGAKPGTHSTVIVTGDLAVSTEVSHILLGLIDGLELYGTVQFLIDDKDIIPGYAKLNVENEGAYSKLIELLIDNKFTLFSAEPEGSGSDEDIIVEGIIENSNGRREFYGLRNRMSRIDLPEHSNLILESKAAKNVGGVSGHAVHHNISGSIVLDCRDHTKVTYGPDYKHNSKVHTWLNSLDN